MQREKVDTGTMKKTFLVVGVANALMGVSLFGLIAYVTATKSLESLGAQARAGTFSQIQMETLYNALRMHIIQLNGGIGVVLIGNAYFFLRHSKRAAIQNRTSQP
jgi:hypothetical protein